MQSGADVPDDVPEVKRQLLWKIIENANFPEQEQLLCYSLIMPTYVHQIKMIWGHT